MFNQERAMIAPITQTLAACMLLVALPANCQVPVPAFEQYVTDQAGVLSADRKQELEAELRQFEVRKGSRIAALIVPTTRPESITQYAKRVDEQWKPGRKQAGDGAILLVAMDEHAAHLEVGDRLKSILTFGLAKRIEKETVSPSLNDGDGVSMGVRLTMMMVDAGPGATFGSNTSRAPSSSKPESAPGDHEIPVRAFTIAAVVVLILMLAATVNRWRASLAAAEAGDGNVTANDSPGPPGAVQPSGELTWNSPSSLAIIAANLVPLWAVLVQGWAIYTLFVLFWLESIVMILLNALRIICVRPGDFWLWFRKITALPLMLLSNGMFLAAYGVSIVSIFARNEYKEFGPENMAGDYMLRLIDDQHLWQPLAMMAAAHGISFILFYIIGGEFRRASIDELVERPVGRLILLHLSIIIGGAGAAALGAPLWAILVLVVLKTAGELLTHLGLVTSGRSSD
jgi:uncharacterized membrane protein YgcG